MRINRTVRVAVIGSSEQGPGYLVSLMSALGLGTVGALLLPVNPVVGGVALLGMLLIGTMLLVWDRPDDGTYPMRGRDAMELLYAELDRRRAGGEILPFGNWLPLHRVLYEAQRAMYGF